MTLDLGQMILLFVAGSLAGFMNVMAAGGSILTLPILVLMGLPGPVANGTNRIAILVQCLTASASYYRQKVAEPKLSLTLGLCSLPGAVLGAYFGTKLDGPLFNYVLAGVMIMVMVYMMVTQHRKNRLGKNPVAGDGTNGFRTGRPPSPARNLTGCLLMVGVGFYGGFIQAGVGLLLLAALSGVMQMTLVRANVHKVFIMGIYTLVTLVIFDRSGNIAWPIGLCLACGNTLGGLVATRVNLRGGDRVVRIVLYLVILVMSGKLIFENFR